MKPNGSDLYSIGGCLMKTSKSTLDIIHSDNLLVESYLANTRFSKSQISNSLCLPARPILHQEAWETSGMRIKCVLSICTIRDSSVHSPSFTILGLVCLDSYARSMLDLLFEVFADSKKIPMTRKSTKRDSDTEKYVATDEEEREEERKLEQGIKGVFRYLRGYALDFHGVVVPKQRTVTDPLVLHARTAQVVCKILQKFTKRIDSISLIVPQKLQELDDLPAYLLRDPKIRENLTAEDLQTSNPFDTSIRSFFRAEQWTAAESASKDRSILLGRLLGDKDRNTDFAVKKLAKVASVVFVTPFVFDWMEYLLLKDERERFFRNCETAGPGKRENEGLGRTKGRNGGQMRGLGDRLGWKREFEL